jgi:hypothetical protein
VFFLAASAPHRVHHLFEQQRLGGTKNHRPSQNPDSPEHSSHEHDDHHQHSQPSPTDCAVQMAAQNAHLSLIEIAAVERVEHFVAHYHQRSMITLERFDIAAVSPRAPPNSAPSKA